MKKTLICLLILFLWTEPSQAQRRRSTQNPQAQRRDARQQRAVERAEPQPNQSTQPANPAQNSKWSLLPSAETLTDGDAYPLYEQAGRLLPNEAVKRIAQEWNRMKPGELPLDQVRQVLQQCQPALDMVEKAALCRSCNWPAAQPGVLPELTSYRHFSRILYIKAALAMAENRPADAVKTLQTAFAMARHLGIGPGLITPMVGVAVVNLTCRAIPAYTELAGARPTCVRPSLTCPSHLLT